MRVLTYSQGLRIEDPGLVATLAIFCDKTWLPYERAGDAVQQVLAETGALTGALTALQNDPVRDAVRQWDETHDALFKEQVFERLPGPTAVDHSAHRHDFDGKSIAEIVGAQRSIYERLALRFHFTRGDLPGTEFFDSGTAVGDVDLARSVFFLDMPKLSVEPERILDLRADAQAHGLKEFWERIETEHRHAQTQGQPNSARAEKIRADFDKWNHERFNMRGYTAALGLVTTLAVYFWVPAAITGGTAEAVLLGAAAGAAASSVPAWFGEMNARWATYNKSRNKAFNCISRIDRRLART
jgi:hypothetical protein